VGLTHPVNPYKNICEKMTYLVKIFINGTKIQFSLESEPLNSTESLYQKVLDFLGKMSKEQIEKSITDKHISNLFYITYEEVVDGSRSSSLQKEETFRT